MKEGVESTLKFKKLKRRLGLPEWQAIGLLESIWKLTRTSAQAGDIGRHSNEDIAAAIEYEGDADLMIEALVETGWLDTDPEYRLVVHDWSHHVPTYLRGNFAKHQKTFADVVAKQRKSVVKNGATSNVLPNLTKPNQTKPNQKDRSLTQPEFEEFWDAFPKDRRRKKQEAFRRWKQLIQKVDPQELVRRVKVYAKSKVVQDGYAALPSTWLASMYDDEPEGWSGPNETSYVPPGERSRDPKEQWEKIRYRLVKEMRGSGMDESAIAQKISEAEHRFFEKRETA